MSDINENINTNEKKIDIEAQSQINFVGKDLPEDEKIIYKTEEKKDTSLNTNNLSNIVNPLYYEIGFFPRKPQSIWIQTMGFQPVQVEGDVLEYNPSRNDFVRLVFTIVAFMLLLTAGFCIMANMVIPVRNIFTGVGSGMIIIGGVITLAMSYAFSCSACTRSFPCNYICLFITVFGFSLICAYFTIKFSTTVIFLSLITTTIVVVVCLGLACTSFDFTQWILYVIVASLVFCVISLVIYLYMMITGHYIKWLHIVILIVATLIHSLSLVLQLQMILGGKTVELSETDYALAAYMMYSSIVSIFINLLQIIGICGDFD